MNKTKENLKILLQYIKNLFKWLVIAGVTGVIGGATGTAFHKCLDYVTDFRMHNTGITYFMPLGVIIIIAMYGMYRRKEKLDTNLVIECVKDEDKKLPFVIAPFVFIATAITQLFGGSAGREGAALQIGGGIGYNLGKAFKLNKKDINIITMAGMSSVFSALFSTPVTAAIFSLEVIGVGVFNFTGLLPCILASVSAYCVSTLFGIHREAAALIIDDISAMMILKVITLAICCGLISILFCFAIKKSEQVAEKVFKNSYLRGIVGALIVVILTVASGTFDYNGAGMDVVERALSGEARIYDFAMKILFTAISISAGFKGGEIVPTFFVGATFGCIMGPILGIESGLSAAIGMVAVFCGAVNCPIASIILSVEMFGAKGFALFGIACAVSYIVSGYSSLYKSQSFLYPKLIENKSTD